MGSRAFSAVARAVLYAAENPENRDEKVLMQAKNNLGRSDLPELAYTLNQVTVGMFGDEIITSVKLTWGKEQDPGTVRKFIAPAKASKAKVDSAEDWLEDYLRGNGKVPSSEVKVAGDEAGFNERMLQRALAKINGVATRDRVGDKTVSFWEIPKLTTEDVADEDLPWNI
jgi:hypothetical protein